MAPVNITSVTIIRTMRDKIFGRTDVVPTPKKRSNMSNASLAVYQKKKHLSLPVKDCHPEMDTSPLLGLADHRKFQMLRGMLQWLVTIGRPDLGPVVSSLNRFGACPREYHLELAIRVFGDLKTCPMSKLQSILAL